MVLYCWGIANTTYRGEYNQAGKEQMLGPTWWRHQIETFSALLALCAGNSPATGEFPAQRPVTRSSILSLIYAWIYRWVNNRKAGDLRCHRAHYDVTVVFQGRFSIVIHIRWKFHSALIHVVMTWSLWNYANGMTALLARQIRSDTNNNNGFTLKHICHPIWIAMATLFVKWARYNNAFFNDTDLRKIWWRSITKYLTQFNKPTWTHLGREKMAPIM